MRREDFQEFADLLDAAFDLIGKTPAAKIISPTAKALFFQALAEYPLPQVRAAIGEHIKRGEFTPTPAAIIKILEAAIATDTRPGPEEAWAIALAGQDERESVVWTAETFEAMQIARPVLESSGPITGRKTFLEAYTRLVDAARQEKRPAQWSLHAGWDRDRLALVLHQAVKRGQLPAPRGEQAKLLEHAVDLGVLPRPGNESAVPLLEGPEGEKRPELALSGGPRDQLEKVKQMLADGAAERERRLQAVVDQRNETEAEFKRTTAARVRQHRRYVAIADQTQVQREEALSVRKAGER